MKAILSFGRELLVYAGMICMWVGTALYSGYDIAPSYVPRFLLMFVWVIGLALMYFAAPITARKSFRGVPSVLINLSLLLLMLNLVVLLAVDFKKWVPSQFRRDFLPISFGALIAQIAMFFVAQRFAVTNNTTLETAPKS